MNRRIPIILVGVILVLVAPGREGLAESEVEMPPSEAVDVPPDPFRIFATRRAWLPVLDALEPCLPAETPAGLLPVLSFVLENRESAARRVLELAEEARRKEGERLTTDLRLWLAVVSARVADTRIRRADAIHVLDHALARGGSREARVCGFLERGRAELHNAQAPEASASALRALREGEGVELPIARVEAARFLRAEAMLLSRRKKEARVLYESLAGGTVERLATASRLRLVTEMNKELPAKAAWTRLRARFEEARVRDLDLRAFERVAAEFALRAGDSRRALVHISRAADLEGDELATGLATIRKADVWVARGRGGDALTALERLVDVHPDPDVRRLAGLRIVAHGLGEAAEADRMEVLREATISTERGLSLHARALILHRHVQSGEVDQALEDYARLAYDDPDDELAPTHRDDLDAALLAAVESHCPTTVRRLGGRRELLLRQARVSEPFVALADCYLALGMSVPALASYRAVTRAFGPELASRLTLRIARASLGAGDLPAVRAALRAHTRGGGSADVPAGGLAGDSWSLFEAELAIREGRKEAAAELLLPIVRRPDAPLRALGWLAELVAEQAAGQEARTLLEDETSRWQLEPDPQADAAEVSIRAGVALILADRLAAEGEPRRAHYYYGLAAEALPDGPRRARARFHRARLSEGRQRRQAYEEAAESKAASELWSRLASAQLRAVDLQEEVGVPQFSSSPRTALPGGEALR
ncbi:MAG: hypothetical protein GY946_12400 [bacterium]|nr:hypothetical protein [bacterium]